MKHTINDNNSPYSYITLLPIIMALAITPLIVRLAVINTLPKNSAVFLREATQLPDLFTYNKGTFLIVTALLAVAIFIYSLYTKKINFPQNRALIFIYIYAGIVVTSFIFSTNKSLSLIGYHEHYENVFILLTYIIIFFYTAVFIKDKMQVNLIISLWIGSIVIMFLIGISQVLNHDFWFTSIGKALMLPAQYAGANVQGDTETVRNVYQTLYHYNYVSFYAAIALPFFLVLAIAEKTIWRKLLYFFIVAVLTFNQFVSLSRNGFIGIFIALIFVALFLRRYYLKYWKVMLPLVLVIVIGSSYFLTNSDSLTARRLVQGFKELSVKKNYPLNSIDTINDTIIINHDDFVTTIKFEPKQSKTNYNFYNETNELMVNSYDKTLQRNVFEDISPDVLTYSPFNLNDIPAIEVKINNHTWPFIYHNNRFTYVTPYKTNSQLISPPTFGFNGREAFASERGYIWSRSIPLLGKYFLFGSGPDTFPLVFPQNDFVGKYNAYNSTNMIVDKPHNVYLNYGVNTGVLSLVALLAFWGIYIIWSFKLYITSTFESYYHVIGVACLTAVIGYLSSGVFNDTNVNITPIFWVILGIGFAVNSINSRQLH